jgi:hypothetical protein
MPDTLRPAAFLNCCAMPPRLGQDRLCPKAEGRRWKLEFSLFTSPSFNFYRPRHRARLPRTLNSCRYDDR